MHKSDLSTRYGLAAKLMSGLLLLSTSATQAQFDYMTNDEAVTITGYSGSNVDLTIPAVLNGLPVVAFANGAFSGKPALASVTIPYGVVSLGESVFAADPKLTNVTIPDSVASLGDGAFIQCDGLPNITIPGSVKYIGVWAFYMCDQLTNVTLSEGIADIDKHWGRRL
jgi:hypothetical protein